MQTDRPEGMTIGASAALLGVHEFSLLTRIQAGEIQMTRARSGETLIPANELERLLPEGADHKISASENPPSDERLGIKRTASGLKRKGEPLTRFIVPGYDHQLGPNEIDSYRAAFGAIIRETEAAEKLKAQLDDPARIIATEQKEITTSDHRRWQVRSTLLNLQQSDILLCERGFNEFAVVEQFRENTPFARARGQTHVLLEGNQAEPLAQEFKGNARHTLEFMASNAVAKAQKIAWEEFPDHRPGHVVAAISERCRRAVTNAETISENQKMNRAASRGVRM